MTKYSVKPGGEEGNAMNILNGQTLSFLLEEYCGLRGWGGKEKVMKREVRWRDMRGREKHCKDR